MQLFHGILWDSATVRKVRERVKSIADAFLRAMAEADGFDRYPAYVDGGAGLDLLQIDSRQPAAFVLGGGVKNVTVALAEFPHSPGVPVSRYALFLDVVERS